MDCRGGWPSSRRCSAGGGLASCLVSINSKLAPPVYAVRSAISVWYCVKVQASVRGGGQFSAGLSGQETRWSRMPLAETGSVYRGAE